MGTTNTPSSFRLYTTSPTAVNTILNAGGFIFGIYDLGEAVERLGSLLDKTLAAKLDFHKTVCPVPQVDDGIALQTVLVKIMTFRNSHSAVWRKSIR